jgi:hypothetical protein
VENRSVAQRTQVVLIDDVDGGQAVETMSFSLDGISYEIDVSQAHAEEMREALAPWLPHSRRVGGRSTRRPTLVVAPPPAEREDVGAIREWAREHGHQVSDRGRVSAAVRAAYEARGESIAQVLPPEAVADPAPSRPARRRTPKPKQPSFSG